MATFVLAYFGALGLSLAALHWREPSASLVQRVAPFVAGAVMLVALVVALCRLP